MSGFHDDALEAVVRLALTEDLGRAGDLTAQACVPADARLSATFVARKAGVAAGLAAARLAVRALDPDARVDEPVRDGDAFDAGAALVRVDGNARSLLAAERTALNLTGRLCGIATLTRAYVDAVAGTRARIADTRKTTPGLRALEKRAVALGGGLNHRFGLDDAILIKDNHVALCGGDAAEALRRARAHAGHLTKIEVEIDRLDQLGPLLELVQPGVQSGRAGPDVIMLDNFSLPELREAVALTDGRVTLEASGGVTLDTVRSIAETGVDVISVGALTHSAPSLDVGLDVA
ncbi:carboxylating nicotinate-nucleotide diphosphorylase [Brevundimonas fluminis]|jgi:nicotinate-nucleotide pyrophosphorylase (carboxylating)|uniref:carboxylating nicotinate-nucleotide diphosphorylase n=1 Tax=Brevundimonas fluminis TaxID=2487274 RepID=UPI000F657C4D|nr:carboxylating nicotinate-nucleotide diphosphorylase [Brevundimonas fluminis]